MDSPTPMTLPKGILMNSSTVYDEVAGYSTLPADKVYKYWHVYTITNKKLKDPTARRLENFWWHVWGSDRSKLSGRVLARIFEDISLGPTVVPLRGPPNRWEGPDAPPLTVEMIMAHLQGSSIFQSAEPPSSTAKQNTRSVNEPSSTVPRSSQPPPILKKVGSSSTHIVRNTARFVSPHESADEGDVESDIPSSGSTLGNGFATPGHAISNARSHVRGNGLTQELQASNHNHGPHSKISTTGKQIIANGASDLQARGSSALQTDDLKQDGPLLTNTGNTRTGSRREGERQPKSQLSAREKITLGKQPMIRRPQSTAAPDRPRELSMPKPKRSLFTEATSSTTNVAAQGTIIDQAGTIRDLPQLSTSNLMGDHDTSPHGGSSASSLLEARLTPTQPSNSTVLPLGRTKSQLTLLLEREKERSRS
ncbi:hypothetical protein NLG97_g787 [Lecanicillium saksenae]|uniref:Uncharacterized protein n=1 Tax=Lecanicillium saksenae TaxID=468837 RepID=A0ACC1R912_9HYPO|nr:hypothetical protein NLG97_g787 [Lecanicillium saksenae]